MRYRPVGAAMAACLAVGLLLAGTSPAAAQEQGGRFRLDLRLGPSLGLYAPPDYDNSTGLDLQVDFGVRLFAHGELFVAPGFHYAGQQLMSDPLFGNVTVTLLTGIFPVGFRAPFAIGSRGFFLVPRLELGYAASASLVSNGETSRTDFAYFAVALAVEYELWHRWRFLLEPVNLPALVNSDGAKLAYRIFAGVGVRLGR